MGWLKISLISNTLEYTILFCYVCSTWLDRINAAKKLFYSVLSHWNCGTAPRPTCKVFKILTLVFSFVYVLQKVNLLFLPCNLISWRYHSANYCWQYHASRAKKSKTDKPLNAPFYPLYFSKFIKLINFSLTKDPSLTFGWNRVIKRFPSLLS